jgi:hypothetical protein
MGALDFVEMSHGFGSASLDEPAGSAYGRAARRRQRSRSNNFTDASSGLHSFFTDPSCAILTLTGDPRRAMRVRRGGCMDQAKVDPVECARSIVYACASAASDREGDLGRLAGTTAQPLFPPNIALTLTCVLCSVAVIVWSIATQ